MSAYLPRGARWLLPATLVLVVSVVVAAFVLDDSGSLLQTRASPEAPAGDHSKRTPHDLDERASASVVGAEVCSRCHLKQHQALATSGHSRTFVHSSRSEIARSLDGQTFFDPERKYTYRYKFHPHDGLTVSIPGKIDKPFPLQFALGSGTHAVTFLGLVPNRKADGSFETIGIEHRASVFPHDRQQRLRITPGQSGLEADQQVTEFGQVENGDRLQKCVACHTTSGHVDQLSIFDLRENVSCENCHGPGSKHVAAAERKVESPGHLRFKLGELTAGAEVAICGECHRVPEMLMHDFKKGIRREDAQITRFQPVGMLQSACYKKSNGALRCTTCHSPHAGVSRDHDHYIAECLKCHTAGNPEHHACPVSPARDCLRCHMPKIPSVYEVSFTDHWIRVRDERDSRSLETIPVPQRKRDGR